MPKRRIPVKRRGEAKEDSGLGGKVLRTSRPRKKTHNLTFKISKPVVFANLCRKWRNGRAMHSNRRYIPTAHPQSGGARTIHSPRCRLRAVRIEYVLLALRCSFLDSWSVSLPFHGKFPSLISLTTIPPLPPTFSPQCPHVAPPPCNLSAT